MQQQDNQRPSGQMAGQRELHRRQRAKNLAVLAALIAFVAIIYVVAMVRMSGGRFP